MGVFRVAGLCVMGLEKQNCVQGMLLFFKATGMVK